MSNIKFSYRTSKKYRVNARDLFRGLVVACGTSIAFCIQTSLDAGMLEFKWKQIGIAALSSGFAYLTKNYFTASKTEVPTEK